MTSIARFIYDKPMWVFGILAIVVILVLTPSKKVVHKPPSPWALRSASDQVDSTVSIDSSESANSESAPTETAN